MSDPFGEMPEPWWRRMWRRGTPAGVPRRYSVVAAALGPIAGLSLGAVHGIDHITKAALYAIVAGVPSWLLETWWKQRKRRESERLLVLPMTGRQRSLLE
jgi:hypothetical protein